MKIIIICLLSLLSLSADVSFEDDKKKHLAISIPFGMVGETILHQYDLTAVEKITYGTAIGFMLGLAKEAYDEHKYGGFDKYDLAYDALGSVIGALSAYYLLNLLVEPSKEEIKITYNLKF